MNLTLVREYLNLVDENHGSKGYVMPCDIFKHITAQGVEPNKAALLSGVISVMGGLATGSSMPFVSKTEGINRPVVVIPRNLDPKEVMRVGGKGMMNQVLAIAEALLIPTLSVGLERKMAPPPPPVRPMSKGREKGNDREKGNGGQKPKPKGGVFQMIDSVLKNKDALASMLGPLLKNILKPQM